MPTYQYVGVTTNGSQVSGELQAGSKDEVSSILRRRKIRPLSIKNKPIQLNLNLGSGIKLTDISRFTRQFSAMTASGLSLVQCLDVLAQQTEAPAFGKIIQKVSLDIQGGTTLADAMAKHPKVFNRLYVNMVAAGEASGNLDEILARLAEHLEKSEALRRKIKGAMTYPVIVAVVAIGATVAMLTFVVPTFAQMFIDFGGALPAPTQFVVNLSNAVTKYWLHAVVVIVVAIVGLLQYYKTPKGRYAIDSLRLKMPVLGDLERKSSVSRFSQTLSTLLTSGITIVDALQITAKTAGNAVLEKGLMRTVERITGGLTIAEPLRETGVFPPMVIHMVSVGEKTGGLADMLGKVAQFYEEEVDAAVEALTSVIEPIMIVFMGGVVGGILISMYLPMFDMVGAIH
ncbi:MAG: type II secretion system F family protein [Chitinivibrionales bacterium]|nr:type II secretion system F family protein [Chitinivibrionales bacterium]